MGAMKTLLALILAALPCLAAVPYDTIYDEGPLPEIMTANVDEVIDGDTIRVTIISIVKDDKFSAVQETKRKEIVRLRGIDAPELKQLYGPEAHFALTSMIDATYQLVTLRNASLDRYRRIVADVYGRNEQRPLNYWMLRCGWAWHYKVFNANKIYAKAEEDASKARLGLWADPEAMAPWDFRKKVKGHAPADDPVANPVANVYWVTMGTKVIHNRTCAYYERGNGSRTTKLSPEYRNCKLCGGATVKPNGTAIMTQADAPEISLSRDARDVVYIVGGIAAALVVLMIVAIVVCIVLIIRVRRLSRQTRQTPARPRAGKNPGTQD